MPSTTPKKKSTAPRYITDRAAADALAAALKDIPAAWLECRAQMHKMEIVQEMHVTQREKKIVQQIEEVFECERCGVQRTNIYVPTENGIEQVGHKYDNYPEGYQFSGLNIPRGLKPKAIIRSEKWDRLLRSKVGGAKKATAPKKAS